MSSNDELEQVPLRYRLLIKILMKLPNPRIPFLILRRFPEFEGIMWALIAPLFLLLSAYAYLYLIPLLSLYFVFPLNVIIALIMPASLFVFFLRIQIERAANWWRSINEPSKEWNVHEKVEELIKILEKQQKTKT